jgi:hypothetical protein
MNLGKLASLKTKMAETKKFVEAFEYFFDEFAEKDEFLDIGKRVSHPKLEQMIQTLGGLMVGNARFYNFMFIRVPKHSFIHGTCWVNGRLAKLMYFEDVQLGMLAITAETPGGDTLFQRFSARDLPPGWVPSSN